MNKVLLTRSAESNKAFIDAYPHYDYASAPLLTITPRIVAIPDVQNNHALVFTSANAVRIFTDLAEEQLNSFRNQPAFTVGADTEKACREAGFGDIRNADGHAENLIELCKSNRSYDYLYICGVYRAHDIESALKAAQIQCSSIEVYEAKTAQKLSDDTIDALQKRDIEAALFFSRRTAQCFAELILRDNLQDMLGHIKLLCISTAVLECLQDLQWKDTYIAERPNREHMAALLEQAMHDH